MCNTCNQTICCCSEKRVSVAGKKGDPGPRGLPGLPGAPGTPGAPGVVTGDGFSANGVLAVTNAYQIPTGASFTLPAGTYLFWFVATVSYTVGVANPSFHLFFHADAALVGSEYVYTPVDPDTLSATMGMAANEKITIASSKTISCKIKNTGTGTLGALTAWSLQYIKIG